MNRFNRVAAFALLSTGLLCTAGCENMPWNKDDDHQHVSNKRDAGGRSEAGGAAKANAAAAVAVAHVHNSPAHPDKIHGNLTFTEVDGGVHVQGEVEGLTPGKHGFHVHEKGELTDPKFTSAGPHFNPDGTKHGGAHGDMRHAGDLGNITADDKGVAKIDATFKGLSVKGEKNGIVGRSIIIHAKEDDLSTDPSGNSGDRIAGGTIEAKAASGASGPTTKPAKE